ncbi:MAG TPA: aminoglycoside phosphotransferase family protein [Pseudomonadales bacterium]|nr:aminoglycoside phosphotransferase family protein [Pseudomonadales bacterium]
MMKIHNDQLHSDEDLVRGLLEAQFPQWSSLPITAVPTSGTESAIYRLGNEMVVRMPYLPSRDDQLEKLFHWLPAIGPRLPLPIPEPIGRGLPTEEFPAAWSIIRWLPGEEVTLEGLADPVDAARTLANFVRVLTSIDPTGGPAPGTHNFWRGVPLSHRDQITRQSLNASGKLIDVNQVARTWERLLCTPEWTGAPCWLHGDLAPDNMLATNGQLTAVIDWGGLGIGDPAIECLPAWNLFRGESRQAYREALGFDDATWARGRGLALSTAIVALPYYIDKIPVRAAHAREIINEVLQEDT